MARKKRHKEHWFTLRAHDALWNPLDELEMAQSTMPFLHRELERWLRALDKEQPEKGLGMPSGRGYSRCHCITIERASHE